MKYKTNYVFERIERKYLLSEEKFSTLSRQIHPYMSIDKFGLHTICNIYYDTDAFDLIRNSIEKPKYKEKLRLRSYGIPKDDSRVFLEIKKKYDHIVFKRRISLNFTEAKNYLEHGDKPDTNSQILNEIDYFINFYKPEKKLFLAYDRIALFGKEDENFRITFDTNIRSRSFDIDLRKGDHGNPMKNFSGYLMEIKTVNAFPMWLVHILSDLEIYPVSFSKYGSIYKDELVNGTIQERMPDEQFDYKEKTNSTFSGRNIKCLQVS